MMAGADRDLVKVWEKMNAKRFDKVMLKTKTVSAKATPKGIEVRLRRRAGAAGPADLRPRARRGRPQPQRQGHRSGERRRRGHRSRLHRRRQADAHQRPAHLRDRRHRRPADARAQGRARRARRRGGGGRARSRIFDARQIPSVAYTDPEVAWAGLTEDECKKQGIKYGKAVFPWAASGRAIANGRDEGFTKLLFDETTHRCIGGAIVGTHAGDLIGEVCLAVEMGADPVDIGKTIHPHPTLSEIDRHGGGIVRRGVHGPAACEERSRRTDHGGRAAQARRARVSRVSDAGQDLDRAHQDAREPARPVARVFARCRVRVHRHPARPVACRALHRARRISSRSSPTAARCSASATSARSPASR